MKAPRPASKSLCARGAEWLCARGTTAIFLCVSAVHGFSAAAQDARPIYAPDSARGPRPPRPITEAAHSAEWAGIQMVLEPSLSLEYNDNILHSDENRRDELIVRPLLNFAAARAISERNVVRVFTSLGYEKYLNHSENDHWIVEPGTELSFDVFIKDVALNIHERFSYEQDPGRIGAVSGVARFGGIYNTVGFLASYELTDLVMSFGYDYFRFIASPDEFNYLDRNSHIFQGRVGLRLDDSLMAGVEASGGPTDYDQEFFNDFVGFSVGVFADWQISEHVHIEPRAGYQRNSFSDDGLVQGLSDFDAWYFRFTLNHQLNEKITYSIAASREITPSVYANLIDLWKANLSVHSPVARDMTLTARLLYEQGDEESWVLADEYERWGVGVSLNYRLAEKLNALLGYNYFIKDSGRRERDYEQNRVVLTLRYRL